MSRSGPLGESAIVARRLSKSFRIPVKEPGFVGSLRSFVRPQYKHNAAVSPFDLVVEPGEFMGLLGPNGAGKTTLMKMFTGIIAPSGGALAVLGQEPFRRALDFRRRIALVMGQKSQLWWDIPALDSFHLLQKYYEVSDAAFRERLGRLSEMLGVQEQLKIHVRRLSLGERMKMELMACLLHQPDIIFLDEPTIGLDVVAQRKIREFLAEYQREHGTTILLTSHYMADVDALCSRIVLILAGEKRFDGGIKDFAAILGKEKVLSVEFKGPVDRKHAFWQQHSPVWSDGDRRVALHIEEEDLRSTTAKLLDQFPVVDFHTEKMPIERVMETLLANPEILASKSTSGVGDASFIGQSE